MERNGNGNGTGTGTGTGNESGNGHRNAPASCVFVNANANANLSMNFNFQQSARRLRVVQWCSGAVELWCEQAEAVHPSSSHAARNVPEPQDQPEAGPAETTMGQAMQLSNNAITID